MLAVVVAGNQRVDRRRTGRRRKKRKTMAVANLKLAHRDLDKMSHDQGPHGIECL